MGCEFSAALKPHTLLSKKKLSTICCIFRVLDKPRFRLELRRD
jgi:hypothetical protein